MNTLHHTLRHPTAQQGQRDHRDERAQLAGHNTAAVQVCRDSNDNCGARPGQRRGSTVANAEKRFIMAVSARGSTSAVISPSWGATAA